MAFHETRALRQPQRQWFWQENDGAFVPYDEDQNFQIEDAYQSNAVSCEDIIGDRGQVKNGWTYRVEFDRARDQHFQINVQTKKRRLLRHQPLAAKPSARAAAAVASALESLPSSGAGKASARERLTFTALSKADLSSACQSFKTWVKSLEHTATIQNVGKLSAAKIKELLLIGQAYRVSVDYQANALVLTGLKESVRLVETKIAHSLRTLAAVVEFPEKWIDPKETGVSLVQVSRSSMEGKVVLDKIKETMPDAQVHKIEQVQHWYLWRVYAQKRENLRLKYAGQNQNEAQFEKLLFHGSRQTPPSTIFNAEDGFVMNFSNPGMVRRCTGSQWRQSAHLFRSVGPWDLLCGQCQLLQSICVHNGGEQEAILLSFSPRRPRRRVAIER